MAQQTAIEWLIEQMKKGEVAYGMFHIPGQTDVFEQAKAMEKEQIIDACFEGMNTFPFDANKGRAEQYYEQTYKTK